MRCKNCGWPNEDGVTRCVKCNAPLQETSSGYSARSQRSENYDNPNSLKSTLREPQHENGYNQSEPNDGNTCPLCGYPISAVMEECPLCHTKIRQTNRESRQQENPHTNQGGESPRGNNNKSFGGTINPWATPTEESFCTLQRIPWQNEHVRYEPVSYSGNAIVLNRDNTDANNNSITSKEQAILSCEDGEWYIENRSTLKTTLIRVDRKLKLEDGDVIVLGNRMFEFKKG